MNLGAENNRFDTGYFTDIDVENGVIGGGDISVGTIIPYMGTTPPKDFLACDGEIYNIADYQQLANHINRQFGSYNFFGGDGVDTFAVPDLRGEFLRGTGTNSHTNQGSGANVGEHQDGTEIPNIFTANTTDFYGYKSNTENQFFNKFDSALTRATYQTYVGGNNATMPSDLTAPYAVTSRPTNTSVLYCIKYKSSNDITNVTSLDETLLYSGNDPITATTGSTAYTLSDDITNFDYIIVEVEGSQQRTTDVVKLSATRNVLSQVLGNAIVNYNYSIGEHRGDSYTAYFDGWVTCATSEGASTTTIRFALRDKTSNINSVVLKSVIGIKKNSLSTADIAEMSARSNIYVSAPIDGTEFNVLSGDYIHLWFNNSNSSVASAICAFSNNSSSSWVNEYALVHNVSAWQSYFVRVPYGYTKCKITCNQPSQIDSCNYFYSVGRAKALGLI